MNGPTKCSFNKTTEARLRVCNDVRNVVSFCMLPDLTLMSILFNTTISDGTKTKAELCADSKGKSIKGPPTPGQLLTAYYIKWFALISSSGIAHDPLFVVHTAPGLGLSSMLVQTVQ